jgi:aryl-alcohol dehydrogenase-like predicted oxidoreductase
MMDQRASQTITLWDGRVIPRLGFGAWPIAGPFYAGDTQLGYAAIDDRDSIALLQQAADGGIRFFDTAAVYGAGHAEELFGAAFGNRDDLVVATKFGPVFDTVTKQAYDADLSPEYAVKSLDASLRRMKRERVDLFQLHVNSASVDAALRIFDALDRVVETGKIGAYGWSTDFPASVKAVAGRPNFVSTQHAFNVFFDAPSMMEVADSFDLISINRSPLAMGLLGGEIKRESELPANDIRRNTFSWMDYFKEGRAAPAFADCLDRIRELLRTDGRSEAQGALGWIWAKSHRTLPIPGMRSARHLTSTIDALNRGPLPGDVMAEIERVIEREPEGEPRER